MNFKSITALKRLQKEYDDLQREPLPLCEVFPNDDDFLKWEANILGAVNSPYEGGTFRLRLQFTTRYPFKAPNVQFLTKIYHPNIDRHGELCLDILRNAWSPALSVGKLLLSISSLLYDPNPNSPLEYRIADVFVKNREKFNETCQIWVKKYAQQQ